MSSVKKTRKYIGGSKSVEPDCFGEKLRQKHINISDTIELISFSNEDESKDTDVEYNGSGAAGEHELPYFVTTPKEETFYDYVSTPGTVVSDFEYEHTDFEELGKTQKRIKEVENSDETVKDSTSLPAVNISQLQSNTKTALLNECMLFMALENKKINKLNALNDKLETRLKILEGIPKLLQLKGKMKIPESLVSKLQAKNLQNYSDNCLSSSLASSQSYVSSKSSQGDVNTGDCVGAISLKNQHLTKNESDSHKTINKSSAFLYMRGSGIIDKDEYNRNIFKREDGILVILKCKICKKSDFLSTQGILNHYRFKHTDVWYPNKAACLLQNMEYYSKLQSKKVLDKFKELNLNPLNDYLPFNVAFLEEVNLKEETSKSLDEKIEFFKILDLGQTHNVNSINNNNKTDIKIGNSSKFQTGSLFSSISAAKNSCGNRQCIQVISSNENLRSFLKANKTDDSLIDDANNFILNYVPIDIEEDKCGSQYLKSSQSNPQSIVKKRKLSNETELIASMPDRKGKRKISIPRRLLED